MDVWETRAAALRATERCRAGRGPAFLEMMTYRFVGHSRSDPGRYRKPGELERWQERDPLLVGRQRLRRGLRRRRRCGRRASTPRSSSEMTDVIERALAAP